MKTILRSLFLLTAFFLNACGTTDYNVVESAPDVISWDSLRHSVKIMPPITVAHPGKIISYGTYFFINEPYKGWHVVDNTTPSAPHKVAYITAPGSLDGTVIGNYFYINNSADLVVLDISNPSSPIVAKRLQNVLRVPAPPRTVIEYHNGGAVIGWHDTLVIVPISPLG